jgi:hypothetical protein
VAGGALGQVGPRAICIERGWPASLIAWSSRRGWSPGAAAYARHCPLPSPFPDKTYSPRSPPPPFTPPLGAPTCTATIATHSRLARQAAALTRPADRKEKSKRAGGARKAGRRYRAGLQGVVVWWWRQAGRQAGKQASRQTYKQAGKASRQAGIQAGRQAGRQARLARQQAARKGG